MYLQFLTATCLGALTASSSAQTVTFELIPNNAISANDMSSDGRWVVGNTNSSVYRWDTVNDTMIALTGAGSSGIAVSDDGQVVVGHMAGPAGSTIAGRWTQATGWVSLGWLDECDFGWSSPYEISADGEIVTGLAWDGCSGVAFRWTEATGMLGMASLANGNNRASVVSGDGTILAGFAQGSFSRTPAMWDDEGFGTLLDPPDGDAVGEVRGISDDGVTLLGNWNELAFKWQGGRAETIGAGNLLPGWVGAAMDIADDGTIVGFDFLFGNRRAWIQPGGTGDLVLLETYIESHGGTVPDGLALEVCQAISADGSAIIGHGFGNAWRVLIETDCPGDTNGDGLVNVNDLNNVILDWGTDGSANGGDITGAMPGSPPDGAVNVNDLNAVIVNWGMCP